MADNDAYQHGAVTAAVVTVVVPAGTQRVRVINMGGTARVAVTTNNATPSLTGNNRVLPASVGSAVVAPMEGGGTAVKLISDATATTYSVWVV